MPVLDRFTAREGGLLVVDLQEKVLTPMRYGPLVVANARRLVEAAGLLSVPVWATEQYPEGLGPTVPEIAELVADRPPKRTFHCLGAEGLLEQIRSREVRHLTLVGIETHICVAQTAVELLKLGFEVQVPADAVGSRNTLDWEFGLRRLEHAGVVVSTTESVLFEWTETAAAPGFKAVSKLVRDFKAPEKRPKPSKYQGRDTDPDESTTQPSDLRVRSTEEIES